jgi:hypothetical protein
MADTTKKKSKPEIKPKTTVAGKEKNGKDPLPKSQKK